MAIFKMPASVGYFYKNQQAQMTEIGEFGVNTSYAIPKTCFWQTDNLGFRNSSTSKGMDILFIGDSYVTGTSLDQPYTLSALTQTFSGKKAYQIAPAAFDDFKRMLELNLLSKPKTIVFTDCERQLPGLKEVSLDEKQGLSKRDLIKSVKKIVNENDGISNVLTYFDRVFKNAAFRSMKSKITGVKNLGIQSPINPAMFYTFGKDAVIPCTKPILDKTVTAILNYKRFCDMHGINFIFLPGPNKESLYYEDIPLSSQPRFLYTLDSALKKNGINCINTLDLLNREKPNGLLFQLDDGHWNSRATKIVAQKLVDEMLEWNMLPDKRIFISE
jgi:hypothetical protein